VVGYAMTENEDQPGARAPRLLFMAAIAASKETGNAAVIPRALACFRAQWPSLIFAVAYSISEAANPRKGLSSLHRRPRL
jgi:hypothetical protein